MADNEATSVGEVGPYLDVIRAYEKAAQKWTTQGKKIVKRYLDERSDQNAGRLRYNILWANVETLKPAIYAKTPKPEVERRFLDKDPVGRVASEVLERTLDYYLSATPFGSTMRQARMDYLLVGRGIAWARYVPRFAKTPQLTDDTAIGDEAEDVASPEDEQAEDETLTWEDVLSDYVHWRDFGHNIARVWEEVNLVWRIVYMTRAQMKERGFADWLTIPLDYVDKEMKDAPDSARKAAVYECWDKSKRRVYWLSKAHPKFLDERDDFLKLDKFFPCSQPVYATLANESLIPVPDYVEYQDQATELDELTARISALQKAIKAAGVYDASQPAVGRLLSEGVVNELIPVDSWAAMAEKGGLKGAMELLPMEEIAKTLLMLYDARDKVKQDLYEITGMSDIIRGANKASATATSERIKDNYVTMRLSEKQREMQRFARNTIEIMGNIICRHFSDDTIKRVSGVKLLTKMEKEQIGQQQAMQAQMAQAAAQQAHPGGQPAPNGGQIPPAPAQPSPPPPLPDDVQDMMSEPSWDEVLELMRDEPDRSFRIDIETDSTIEMDAGQDRDEAMAFLQAVGGFIQAAKDVPPGLAPLAGQMLEFGVRKWRVGRSLEGAINKAVEDMEKQAKNPPQPQPDPAMMKVQQDGQIQQAKLQSDQQAEQARIQGQQQLEALKLHSAEQMSQMKAQADAQAEQARAQNDFTIQQMKQQAEQQAAAQQAAMEAEFDRWKALLDARTKVEVAEIAAGATLDAAQVAAANQGAE